MSDTATKLLTLGDKGIYVLESFDQAINKFWPVSGQASSAMEARDNSTYTTLDGNRILINPQLVKGIEENAAIDEEDKS